MAVYTPKSDAELAAIVTSAGDTVLLTCGLTYSAASVPANLITPGNITIGAIGTGPKPIISGGTQRSDWAFNATHNVWSRPSYAGNTLGNVTEDGWPMKYVAWNTDLATTAAAMNAGQLLPYWSGSMTYDPATFTVYIRPSAGLASEHVYIVSEVLNGISNSSTNRNLLIDGIDIRHVSRHGLDLKNKIDARIRNSDFRMCGGVKPASLWLGNGIELSIGTWGAETTDCTFQDIFDAPVTSQLYETVPTSLGWHLWQRLTMARFGQNGVEVSCQTATQQVISDVEIADITATDQGTGWSGDRNASVICCLTQGGQARVTRVFARNVRGTRQRRLYLGFQHGGVCGIEDSTGTGSYGQGPRSDQGSGLFAQTDLMRGVTDNLARVGSSWVDSTARLSASRRGVML